MGTQYSVRSGPAANTVSFRLMNDAGRLPELKDKEVSDEDRREDPKSKKERKPSEKYASLLQGMIKAAATRADAPANKRFIALSGDQVDEAVKSQTLLRRVKSMQAKSLPKGQRRAALRAVDEQLERQLGGRIAGTVFRPRGAKRSNLRHGDVAVVNRDMMKGWDKAQRRNVIAHEAFHAYGPKGLRHSELAAHAVGGWRSKKNLAGKLTGAAGQVGHAIRTRPGRVAIEAAPVAAVGYGAYRAAKALKKRRDQKSLQKAAAELTAAGRKSLAEGAFALPGRRYPIHDISHARNALARVAQHGTAEEKARVRAAVDRRFPSVDVSK